MLENFSAVSYVFKFLEKISVVPNFVEHGTKYDQKGRVVGGMINSVSWEQPLLQLSDSSQNCCHKQQCNKKTDPDLRSEGSDQVQQF